MYLKYVNKYQIFVSIVVLHSSQYLNAKFPYQNVQNSLANFRILNFCIKYLNSLQNFKNTNFVLKGLKC